MCLMCTLNTFNAIVKYHMYTYLLEIDIFSNNQLTLSKTIGKSAFLTILECLINNHNPT